MHVRGCSSLLPASSDPTRKKGCRWQENSVYRFLHRRVDAIQDLQGQEGVEIRAAKGTIQYKSDMQMQLMFNIAGFVLVITNFRGL